SYERTATLRNPPRKPCLPHRIWRVGPLRRPHRLLQRGRALSGVSPLGDHDAGNPDLSLDLYRPAARRALDPRRGAERGVHPPPAAAIPRDRRFLAAARRLLLPNCGGGDPQDLSRPGQAGDDGDLVVSAP